MLTQSWKLTFKVKIICTEYFGGNFKQFQSTFVGKDYKRCQKAKLTIPNQFGPLQ